MAQDPKLGVPREWLGFLPPVGLVQSRKCQNGASPQLAEQVLGALIELLRGFQAADEASNGQLLSGVAADDFYGGLLTTLLRLFFLLYAEDHGLMPRDPVYTGHYAVTGLYDRLREDAGRNPDTMDQRYGAWADLLSLFRLIYRGGAHGDLQLLGRRGQLFDPDEYAFLEGRPAGPRRDSSGLSANDLQPPRVSDRVIHRVLQALLVLDGERLAYRTLDVEQIGSVYEAMMGFEVRRGSPAAMYLQPGEERRRSGSHYTPRALTEPIVRATLRPVLEALGPHPTAAQVLALKVGDPAMGSGAFLIEACRQLAEALVAAWEHHGNLPKVPLDEKLLWHARKLVAQRCLYGVDKNPFAVNLAKLSLWLVTRAQDYPFTFLDHAIKLGDSLVGFHWESEFPEVFAGENPGFAAVVGNPPFLRGSRISTYYGSAYLEALLTLYPDAHGNGDLVAYFFRRAYDCLQIGGTLGFVATKTVAEGDTRNNGLRWICTHGGTIYEARRRIEWPGQAAVIISLVHLRKAGACPPPYLLDGQSVNKITSFLSKNGGDDNPQALPGRESLYFSGSKINGKGFILTPDERTAWIAKDSRNAAVIRPFMDGENLTARPQSDPFQYVICFAEWPLETARQWPGLLRHLEETVLPVRAPNPRAHVRDSWWQYEHYRPALYKAIKLLPRVLACPFVSKYFSFVFIPADTILCAPHFVFALPDFSTFGLLQGRIHEAWARTFSSSRKDDLRYAASDCFETFPFPAGWEESPQLDAVGAAYYQLRADVMQRRQQSLTEIYNGFHDPDERDPDILQLRQRHAAMDRAVLDAYGWTDLPTACEFSLDFVEDEDKNGTLRRRKKPYRLRWPAEVHDEVLTRLLDLNQNRVQVERLADISAGPRSAKGAAKSRRPR